LLKRREHIYKYDQIIIGGNLGALVYSYLYGIPVIINSPLVPNLFEYFSADINLDSLNINNLTKELKSLEKIKKVGNSKLELWYRLFFILSLSGLILIDKATTTRIKAKQLLITIKKARLIQINFNKLLIFDDENVHGLPLPIIKYDEKEVLDWMIPRPCSKHSYNFFETTDSFVKNIFFYPTKRLHGYHEEIKDLVAVSYLTTAQLENYQYSDAYAKFKTLKMLNNAGITGSKNGYRADGKPIHYKLKLEVERREVRKVKMNFYKNSDHIKFNYDSEEDIIKNNNVTLNHYGIKLNAYLKENDRKRQTK